jgi:hypothetical protein
MMAMINTVDEEQQEKAAAMEEEEGCTEIGVLPFLLDLRVEEQNELLEHGNH